MFDFKQLLKSLEVNPSAASSAGSQSLRYGSRKANHDSEFCPDKCSSNKKNGVPKSSSDNSEGMTDRENMKPIDSNEESDKVNQDLSTNYLKKTATCKLLGNLLANLKNMHSIMFEEVLNQTSTLLNSPSSAHADERKGAEAASRSATETSYVGGILDQASSYLPGMPTQGLGSFEDPPLYMTRLSSTSTSSNSSCSSASPECGRPTEVNRYNFSKSNAAQSEVSSRYGLQSAEVLRGFVCPIRSEWSKSGPDH